MPHSFKHGTELCCNRMMIMTMPFWTESAKKKKKKIFKNLHDYTAKLS